jgi:hypothetical protein
MDTYLILQTVMFAVNSDGNENCVLLGYYAERSGNTLTNFRDDLSVMNYQYSLRNNQEVHEYRLPRGGRLKSAGNLRCSVGRKQKFNTGILKKKNGFQGNQTLFLKNSAGTQNYNNNNNNNKNVDDKNITTIPTLSSDLRCLHWQICEFSAVCF